MADISPPAGAPTSDTIGHSSAPDGEIVRLLAANGILMPDIRLPEAATKPDFIQFNLFGGKL